MNPDIIGMSLSVTKNEDVWIGALAHLLELNASDETEVYHWEREFGDAPGLRPPLSASSRQPDEQPSTSAAGAKGPGGSGRAAASAAAAAAAAATASSGWYPRRTSVVAVAAFQRLCQALGPNLSLRTLELHKCHFDAAGVAAGLLAVAIEQNRILQTLRLIGRTSSSAGLIGHAMDRLGQGLEHNYGLSELVMEDVGLGHEEAERIAEVLLKNPRLLILSVAKNELGLAGLARLGNALAPRLPAAPRNATLTSLNVSENDLGDESATAIANLLRRNHTLKTLIMTGNEIGQEGSRVISAALEFNETLQALDVSHNNFGAASVIMGRVLEDNVSITEIIMAEAGLGIGALISIMDGLRLNKFSALLKLDVSDNRIGDMGIIRAVCPFLQDRNCSLEEINIAGNLLTPKAVEELGKVIRPNLCLKSMSIADNAMGNIGLSYLVEGMLFNSGLQHLNISETAIKGPIALAHLRRLIIKNPTLTSIDISGNELGISGVQSLVTAIEKNHSLTTMNISENMPDLDYYGCEDGFCTTCITRNCINDNDLWSKMTPRDKVNTRWICLLMFPWVVIPCVPLGVIATLAAGLFNRIPLTAPIPSDIQPTNAITTAAIMFKREAASDEGFDGLPPAPENEPVVVVKSPEPHVWTVGDAWLDYFYGSVYCCHCFWTMGLLTLMHESARFYGYRRARCDRFMTAVAIENLLIRNRGVPAQTDAADMLAAAATRAPSRTSSSIGKRLAATSEAEDEEERVAGSGKVGVSFSDEPPNGGHRPTAAPAVATISRPPTHQPQRAPVESTRVTVHPAPAGHPWPAEEQRPKGRRAPPNGWHGADAARAPPAQAWAGGAESDDGDGDSSADSTPRAAPAARPLPSTMRSGPRSATMPAMRTPVPAAVAAALAAVDGPARERASSQAPVWSREHRNNSGGRSGRPSSPPRTRPAQAAVAVVAPVPVVMVAPAPAAPPAAVAWAQPPPAPRPPPPTPSPAQPPPESRYIPAYEPAAYALPPPSPPPLSPPPSLPLPPSPPPAYVAPPPAYVAPPPAYVAPPPAYAPAAAPPAPPAARPPRPPSASALPQPPMDLIHSPMPVVLPVPPPKLLPALGTSSPLHLAASTSIDGYTSSSSSAQTEFKTSPTGPLSVVDYSSLVSPDPELMMILGSNGAAASQLQHRGGFLRRELLPPGSKLDV